MITNKDIQGLFKSDVYERGLAYFNQNKVTDLLYDRNHSLWTANVHGTETYFVEVNLKNLKNGSIRAYCDCAAFDTYGTCKHIAAVLLSIERKVKKEQKMVDYEMTNRFLQAITMSQTEDEEFLSELTPMHVEYYVKYSYDRNLYLELKTGEGRCFVVRNLQEFLENVFSGREHVFTKTFTYSPDLHYFLAQDLEIFEMLHAMIRNEEIYRSTDFYFSRNNGNDKRALVIPVLNLRQLLERLIHRHTVVEVAEKEYSHVDIIENTLPFQFALTKNEQSDLLLQMEDVRDAVYMRAYQLLFFDGTFYFPTKEQIPIVEQIASFGTMTDTLPIQQEQTDLFLSEVLPSLKQVGEVVISDEVKSEIIQVPLRAKLYLEFRDELIIGKLEYHYDHIQLNPFQGSPDEKILIIRDTEKEKQIMRLMEHANFHYNGKELYLETDDEELYEFFYKILPLLDKHVELFLTSEMRHYILDYEPVPSTNVRVESASNLLEIGFEMDGIDEEEINHLLHAVIERKRFYRLRSGALLSLENDHFASIQQLFTDLHVKKSDIDAGQMTVPVYRGLQIDELMDTRKNYDPSFRKLLHQLRSPEEQVYEIPEQLAANLRHYQKTGYQWFKSLSAYQLGGILADDMGLGKTIQSITYLLSEPSERPHLIIAPSSVLYNWKREFEKFAPSLKVAVIRGTPMEREEMIADLQHMDVWITSYATLRQDMERYEDLSFQTLILDEAQYIKNYATKTSKAIRSLTASRKFALSGTPIENTIDELWAIFQVVLPGLMPALKEFRQLEPEKISQLTKPFILRRLKTDVLTELPEKIESTHISELTKEQKELYVGYLRQLQQETAQSLQEDGFQKSRMKILAGLTRLRQICCHPSLFIENYEGTSSKLEQLMETVKASIENGKRMLIFSQFTSMHELIAERFEQEGISYFYLHGQTPAENRVDMSEQFNQGEKEVFLISLRAGGTGLNLTGADTVILYDLWWNPAVEDQATGRAHRFGQKNVVHVIRLITEGTIEEKIYELQQKKRKLIDQIIQPGETMLSSMTEEDIRELLNM